MVPSHLHGEIKGSLKASSSSHKHILQTLYSSSLINLGGAIILYFFSLGDFLSSGFTNIFVPPRSFGLEI
jgi:hypothetical protein